MRWRFHSLLYLSCGVGTGWTFASFSIPDLFFCSLPWKTKRLIIGALSDIRVNLQYPFCIYLAISFDARVFSSMVLTHMAISSILHLVPHPPSPTTYSPFSPFPFPFPFLSPNGNALVLLSFPVLLLTCPPPAKRQHQPPNIANPPLPTILNTNAGDGLLPTAPLMFVVV